MFKKKYSALFAFIFLAVFLLIGACQDDHLLHAPQKTEQSKEQQEPAYISAIKSLLNDEPLSLPVMYNVKELASSKQAFNYPQLNYTLDNVDILWDSLKIFHEGKREIYWIPMIPDHPMVGFVYLRSGGEQSTRANAPTFHLLAWKKGEQMTAKVITYLPDNAFLKKAENPMRSHIK